MNKDKITFKYKISTVVGDIIPSNTKPQLLFLHGAGSSNKDRFLELREILAKDEISSVAFDFLGHGETGGNMHDSGLKERTEQAEFLITSFNLPEPLIIVGSSMGAYNAIKLTEKHEVKLLILFVPAVYSIKLYEIPFSPKFTSFVHEPNSWDATDAWKILSKYKGKLLIFYGGKDKIIPKELVKKIYDSASLASYKEIIEYKDWDHHWVKFLKENPEELKKIAKKIISLI